MPSKPVTSVDAYIAAQPKDLQRALSKVRAVIRKAVPAASETISYKMPTYKLHGRVLLYFAGWTEHYAMYPGSAETILALKHDLTAYKVSKGTIRFERSTPVPLALIKRIVKQRETEVLAKIAIGRRKS